MTGIPSGLTSPALQTSARALEMLDRYAHRFGSARNRAESEVLAYSRIAIVELRDELLEHLRRQRNGERAEFNAAHDTTDQSREGTT